MKYEIITNNDFNNIKTSLSKKINNVKTINIVTAFYSESDLLKEWAN